MRVLVTGGSGYLGRVLVRMLDGWVYSRNEQGQVGMRGFIGDVRDRERLRVVCRGFDFVVHAAALKRVEVGESDPGEMALTNVFGSKNVVEVSQELGIKALLVSSDKAISPRNCYGATKLIGERLFLKAGFPVVRFGNIAGSTGSVIPTWKNSKAPKITDPECTRYWLTVKEAVEYTKMAMNRTGVFVPDLPAFRLGDLADAMGIKPEVVGLPQVEKLHETMNGITDSSTARRTSIDELKILLEYC